MSTTYSADINDTVLEAIMDAGFLPIDEYDELDLTARQAKVLGYFEGRGWDTFRLVAGGGFDLARWGEDGIELMSIDNNGVTNAEARFDFNAKGAAWFSAAIAA